MVNRAEELIACLEAELETWTNRAHNEAMLVVKRDARIAELEAITPCKCPGLYCVKANELEQQRGVVLPDTKHLKSAIDGLPDSYSKDDVIYGWQEALELVARLNASATAVPADHSAHALNMVPDDLQSEIERAAKFVEVVRECERLASSFCGSIDGVDEHGGDDHEDPTCAIWHRLYYAMFDGEKVIAELRRIAAAPSAPYAQQKEK